MQSEQEVRRSSRTAAKPHGRYLDSDYSEVEKKRKDKKLKANSQVSNIEVSVLKVI